MTPQTKSFNGDFLLFRKDGPGMRKTPKGDGPYPPRFRHKTWAGAEAEAERLLERFPESTFIVLQEVGRVKMKPGDTDAATGCADDQTFADVPMAVLRSAAGMPGGAANG